MNKNQNIKPALTFLWEVDEMHRYCFRCRLRRIVFDDGVVPWHEQRLSLHRYRLVRWLSVEAKLQKMWRHRYQFHHLHHHCQYHCWSDVELMSSMTMMLFVAVLAVVVDHSLDSVSIHQYVPTRRTDEMTSVRCQTDASHSFLRIVICCSSSVSIVESSKNETKIETNVLKLVDIGSLFARSCTADRALRSAVATRECANSMYFSHSRINMDSVTESNWCGGTIKNISKKQTIDIQSDTYTVLAALFCQ